MLLTPAVMGGAVIRQKLRSSCILLLITPNLKYFIGAMADIESQMRTPQWKAKGTRLGSKKYK